jgi:hypothetical protein
MDNSCSGRFIDVMKIDADRVTDALAYGGCAE